MLDGNTRYTPLPAQFFQPSSRNEAGRGTFPITIMGKILNNAEKFRLGIAFGCLPPQSLRLAPNKTPRFTIPTATICRITKIDKINWSEYITAQKLAFDRYEKYNQNAQEYEFRYRGWLIQVWWKHVQHWNDDDNDDQTQLPCSEPAISTPTHDLTSLGTTR